MGNRVNATITIGGPIPAALVDDLLEIINNERLSTDWNGGEVTAADFEPGEPLFLCANEVNGGVFDELCLFLQHNRIAYRHTWEAYPGEWEAGVRRYNPEASPPLIDYDADSCGRILFDIDTIRTAGDWTNLEMMLLRAEWTPPALEILG